MQGIATWILRLSGHYGWKERQIRKSSKNLAGGCVHGINGILTNVMNASETIGPPASPERLAMAGRPGRIPAQLVAHTLFYFTKPGDLVLDPMASGGVVSDVCLLFERKCQSFDLALRDNRPEIQRYYWDPQNWTWPVTKKPDLIFFDPPYYIKKEKASREKATEETPSISSYSKESYEKFIESFFILAYQNTGETTRMAFLNADWRDFESTPASKEKPDNSITIFDYHKLLSKTGWKVTHRIECPPVLRTPKRKPGTENAGQTYFRNCRKNLANRKKIIRKPCPLPVSLSRS